MKKIVIIILSTFFLFPSFAEEEFNIKKQSFAWHDNCEEGTLREEIPSIKECMKSLIQILAIEWDLFDYFPKGDWSYVNSPNWHEKEDEKEIKYGYKMRIVESLEMLFTHLNLSENKEKAQKHIQELIFQAAKTSFPWKRVGKELFRIIYNHTYNFSFQDENGDTPIIHAIRSGHDDFVRMMLSPGRSSSEYKENNDGNTALDIAKVYGRLEVIKMLGETPTPTDIKNKELRLEKEKEAAAQYEEWKESYREIARERWKQQEKEYEERQAREMKMLGGAVLGAVQGMAGGASAGVEGAVTGAVGGAVVGALGGDTAAFSRSLSAAISEARRDPFSSLKDKENSTEKKIKKQPKTFTLEYSCDDGGGGTYPIVYFTTECKEAAINFAKAFCCNAYEDFASVQSVCEKTCGRKDCRPGKDPES